MKGKTNNTPPEYRKTFRAALSHFFKENIPALSGNIILTPVVDVILEMIDQYFPPGERLRPGQTLWYGTHVDETSGYGKKVEDCRITPVIVDLVTEAYVEKVPKRKRQRNVAVRIHNQAFEQGAVFTYSDTAAIMRLSPNTVGKYIREYEKECGVSVPRRGNIHDMGPTLTHKRQICVKHLFEGKTVEETARETNHSPEAVSRYTKDFKRVYTCLKEGWDLGKIKQTTGLSESLSEQYIDMIENQNSLLELEELPF
jgi:AraC-like DNA-binding protein